MKACRLFLFLILLFLPMLALTQTEGEKPKIQFAFVNQPDGNPGDALFLKEGRYKNSYQYQVANEVFESLIEARGDFRMQKPELKMSNAEKNVAIANPIEGTIFLEMKAYALCATFGKDSLNALAALLSHELIHYYEKHEWTENFAAENENTNAGNALGKLEERLKLETQADDLGGFLAYSAGYQTLDMMPRFLKEVYENYPVKDTIEGYPPLTERIALAEKSLEKVQNFVLVFETANYLMALNQYESAKTYFDFVLKEFQSREIYNNVGVIAAQIAMEYVDPHLLKFGFPLELDVESRLKNGLRGTTKNDLAEKLLGEALEYLKKANNLDEKYPVALLNMACVYALSGNFKHAEFYADNALSLCEQPKWEKTKSDIFVLQGILADLQEDAAKAETLFQKASDSGNPLALINLGILKNEQSVAAPQRVRNTALNKDQIDGYSLDKAVIDFFMEELKVEKVVTIDRGICGAKQLENSRLFIHFDDADHYAFIQKADETYADATKLGIKNGSKSEEVLTKYGEPDRRIETSKGSFFVYFNTNLIFQIDAAGSVHSWGVFRMKDKK